MDLDRNKLQIHFLIFDLHTPISSLYHGPSYTNSKVMPSLVTKNASCRQLGFAFISIFPLGQFWQQGGAIQKQHPCFKEVKET